MSGFCTGIYYQGASALALLGGQSQFTRQILAEIDDLARFSSGLLAKRPRGLSKVTAQGNFLRFDGLDGRFLVECLPSDLLAERIALLESADHMADGFEGVLYDPLAERLVDPASKIDSFFSQLRCAEPASLV